MLVCPPVGMQEHQLKELAYTMFFGACGKRSNAELIQVMRAQLEVGLLQQHLQQTPLHNCIVSSVLCATNAISIPGMKSIVHVNTAVSYISLHHAWAASARDILCHADVRS